MGDAEEINILCTPILSFKLPENLLEDTLHKVKQMEWRKNFKNKSSNESLHEIQAFKNLHDFLKECIEDSRIHLKLPFEKMVLTQSWANKTVKNEEHHLHNHQNSFMSGILYLTSHKSGHTYFLIEDIWKTNLFYGMAKWKKEFFAPEAGKILIFPSELHHGVDPLKEEEERYSISFNTFPTGKIGAYTAGLILDTKAFNSNTQDLLLDQKM